MRKIRLRTKFLLSLVAISAGLTAATLLIVGYYVRKEVRQGIQEDLGRSVNVYQSFAAQREATLTRSAELLADLPTVRAVMGTHDAPTIQDASADFWRLSGSDLLVLADPAGQVMGLRTGSAGFDHGTAQELLRHSLAGQQSRDWWFGGGHLYEVWIRPVYFGEASNDTTLGFLAIGYEIDQRAAKDFSNVVSSEVAFYFGDTPVATTLSDSQQAELARQIHGSSAKSSGAPQKIQLGNARYLHRTVSLSPEGMPSVSLVILRSLDQAEASLNEINKGLLALGLISLLAGSTLVFLISHTFTRPLANLVGGVRALERGDFSFPLHSEGGDEVAEVTGAFDRMRGNLRKTQDEQKDMAERLRQAHKMEAVGRLAGGIAHDFNNLLTVIRGHSDILLDREGADDAQKRGVEQIRKAADRAVSMTRQLLAFSRMQVLQPRVLALNDVVADMGKMLPRLIGEHIEFIFQPGEKLAAVKADPGQIEQVIMNLAVNARDAMPEGGKLTVRTMNVGVEQAEASKITSMPAGRYVLLSVRDTGHGMDEETKTHIFEPFFTTKELGKGTGLGLATVYGVVKQSGGFISVESSPENGATFQIYLPQVMEKIAVTEMESKTRPVPHGSETILVVEDEPGVRELACQFLSMKGYAVLQAKDGFEALEIVAQHSGPIHLVLSDMVMPKMTGSELAEKLKATRPDVKILLMSGYYEYSATIRVISASTIPMLQKPFSPISLVEKVREVLTGLNEKQPAEAPAHPLA